MGYPGYPQQQQNWQGGGYPQPQGSPALAVITAVVGLLMAGALIWQSVELLSSTDGFEVPAAFTAMVIAQFVVAGIAFIGVVLVFSRVIAGAFVLLISGVLGIGVILAAPVFVEYIEITMVGEPTALYGGAGENGGYFKALFEFANLQATMRFTVLALGAILLITAALPPSLNWLRQPRQNGYSAHQPGW